MEIRLLLPETVSREVLDVLLPLADTSELAVEEAAGIVGRNLLVGIFTFVGREDDRPVAIGSVVVERKLIHNGGRVAHLEDISVREDYQRRGLGRQIVHRLLYYAREAGCYKAILDCKPELVPFYESCGMRYQCNCMRADLQ